MRRFLLCARGIIIAADTVRTDRSVRPALRGLFTYYERNGRFESTAWLYSEALSASPCRAFGHGIRSSVFYQGEPGDVADLKRAVCCQSVYTFDGGDSDDRHALCFYRTSDTDPEEKLSSYPAHAAPGRIFLRISDGFRRVGGPRDLISCVLAAVGPLPDRYFLVAVGVSLEVKAGVVVLAGEGVVLAICRVLPVKFGYMKVGFDVTLVVIACILSVVFTGHLQGVREGTVAAAVMVGLIAKQLGRLLSHWKLEGDLEGEA